MRRNTSDFTTNGTTKRYVHSSIFLFVQLVASVFILFCHYCIFLFSTDRGIEQIPVSDIQAHDLPGESFREGLHQKKE